MDLLIQFGSDMANKKLQNKQYAILSTIKEISCIYVSKVPQRNTKHNFQVKYKKSKVLAIRQVEGPNKCQP